MPLSLRASANKLLASLHGATLDRMLPHLTLVDMAAGETLYENRAQQAYAYFPVTATVALSWMTPGGVAAEISIVGNEGVVGIPLFLNGRVAPCGAVVRESGTALRIRAPLLTSEFNRPGPALRLMLAYARDLNGQMAQSALCDEHGVATASSCATCGLAPRCPPAVQGRLDPEFSASSTAATAWRAASRV